MGVCGSVVLDYGRLGLRRPLSWGFVFPISDGGETPNNALSLREHSGATDEEGAPKRIPFSCVRMFLR